MTLQEAIKSGKRFKRRYHAGWMWLENGATKYSDSNAGEQRFTYHDDDILATDWITEEPVKKTKRITVWRPIYFHLFEGFHSPSNWNEKHHSCWDRYKESGHTRVGWESKEIEVEE